MKKCKRCGKKWCGTDKKLKKLYGDNYAEGGLDGHVERVTYGSKGCRDKGPKR